MRAELTFTLDFDLYRFQFVWILKPVPTYCQTSNISGTFVGNEIVGHSDVVGASPVSAAPTTSSFST